MCIRDSNNYTQLRGCISSVSYYERYLSAPIEITVAVTSVEMNQRMLKIINFSDGYKVTTNAFFHASNGLLKQSNGLVNPSNGLAKPSYGLVKPSNVD